MLFHLFCMFYNYWRIVHRSQNSAGKRSVKIPYLRRSALPGNYRKVPILPEDGESQKGSRRRATMGPHHAQARAHLWPRLGVVRRPWPTSGVPLRRTSSPRNPKTRRIIEGIFRRLCGTKNNRERKALRQGEICRGNSFPEGGKHRHRHRHRAGLHRDHHHHHHLHHHHHHLHSSTPFRCNI